LNANELCVAGRRDGQPNQYALLAQGMRQMDRKRLARIAYIAACDRLYAQFDARQITGPEARAKLDKLRAAYEKRKQDIELRSFLTSRGLGFILDRKAA